MHGEGDGRVVSPAAGRRQKRGWMRVAGWLVVVMVGVFSACADLVTEPRTADTAVPLLTEGDPTDPTDSSCGNGFAQWQCDAIEDALNYLMNHWDPLCQQLGQTATTRYQNGDFYYDGTGQWSDYGYMWPDQSGTYLGWSAFSANELADTIAHEESHHHGYEDLKDGSENDAYGAGERCA